MPWVTNIALSLYITNDVKHNFLTLEDVELNQRGQQYILVQNDLNKLHFTSLLQYQKCVIAYWLVRKIFVVDVKHQLTFSWKNLIIPLNI